MHVGQRSETAPGASASPQGGHERGKRQSSASLVHDSTMAPPRRAPSRCRPWRTDASPNGLYNPGRSAYLAPVSITEEQLARDLTAAMKSRDSQRLEVLRGVVAAAKLLKVERRVSSLEEADLVQVLRKELRKREEAEEFAAKAGRTDLVAQNRAERSILEGYVPALLGEADLERAIRESLAGGTPRQLGPVMSALRERYAGRYDGKTASELARRILAEPVT